MSPTGLTEEGQEDRLRQAGAGLGGSETPGHGSRTRFSRNRGHRWSQSQCAT